MRKRSKRNVNTGTGYRWMDTYGDLVTLMLCFFVMLFAMAIVDDKKYEQVTMSLSGLISPIAFALDPGPANMDVDVQLTPNPSPGEDGIQITPRPNKDVVDAEFDMLYFALQAYVRDEAIDDVNVQRDGRLIKIRFSDQIFFDSGSAALKSQSIEIVESIIPFLVQHEVAINTIRVEGHTDDKPIRTAQYTSNWWLSLARAGTVVEYLLDHSSITKSKLSADGRGEYNPISSNDTEEGRAKNRRVEFVIEEIEVETISDALR